MAQSAPPVTGKQWSDPTANPLTDLKPAQRFVSGASGLQADLIVMGKDAGHAFEANPNVQDAYNKLSIQSGALNPQALSDIAGYGVTSSGVACPKTSAVQNRARARPENSAPPCRCHARPSRPGRECVVPLFEIMIIPGSSRVGFAATRRRCEKRARPHLGDRRISPFKKQELAFECGA
jgi:Phage major capsid protein E